STGWSAPCSALFPYTTLFRSVRPDRVVGHSPLLGIFGKMFQRVAPRLEVHQLALDGSVQTLHLPLRLRMISAAVNRMDPKAHQPDRKSTRLNSSHLVISYAVF